MNDPVEQRVMFSHLFDIYGAILTDKQREAFRLHVMEDWSLSEVAERLEVTRQGAHDLVQRSKDRLLVMEELLGFSTKEAAWEGRQEQLRGWLRGYSSRIPPEAADELAAILALEERED
ncbi:MAG: sigma factor-like helix-turn-helix DNA-binding protein [Thermovirgaceae bacterium]